jgi:triosephosphate isomerase
VDNVKNFVTAENISGVLIGGSSLEAEEFVKVIENA